MNTKKTSASLLSGIIPLLLAITGLAALAPIGTAQAREPVLNGPYTVGREKCGFIIDVGVVSDKEYKDVVTLADGTTITHITGKLVLSYTNRATGFTITRNVSGPTTETDRLDGTGTFVGEGLNSNFFGPTSQANTGMPGLVFTSGLIVMEFGGGAITSFTHKGKLENGCELLAH